MYKCIVCRNCSLRTRYTRPDVVYHTFPKNEYRRRKWLKIYGMDQCYEWHRICSDHFLEENYRPGPKRFLKKNTIPQPYNRNCDENDFLSDNDVEMGNNAFLPTEKNRLSYTTQDNDVQTSTNEFLPMEQNSLIYTTQDNDVQTSTNEVLPMEQNHLSYTTQSNDVQTSTNEFLPMEQNHLSYTPQSIDVETSTNEILPKKKRLRKLAYDESDYIESEFYRKVQNAVINNFESPRRSCRKIKLTTTNEDMSYENMPRLQTRRIERQVPTFIANENNQTISDRVIVPVLSTTKDYTLGNGPRCSVKNCFNRFSKDLSFFGYPSDFTLRKKWIEKCGIQIDPTQKVKSNLRVCRAHFDDSCFLNPGRKNRLKPDAIPSLFVNDDVIDVRNIPSTSSPVNSGFIRVNKPSPVKSGIFRVNKQSLVKNRFNRANKPSCSSTNYVADMESSQTPLLVYINSTIRLTKNFQSNCSVPGCITNEIEEFEDISLFAPPIENVNQWSSSLGLNLTADSIVCERHFRPQDLLNPNLLINGSDSKLKTLKNNALPVPESNSYCSIPGCKSNTVKDSENISFFAPKNHEDATLWSSSLGFDLTINSIVCELHFNPQDILQPDLMENDLNSKLKSLAPFATPVPIMKGVPTTEEKCCIPGCITNEIAEEEDISFYSPDLESMNEWSSILGVQLNIESTVCERHFQPHDLFLSKVLINGAWGTVKSKMAKTLPIPINAGLSSSNSTPFIQQLETNDVPVLRTYAVKSKRHKPDELLCTKIIKNNVLDKSLVTTNKMFSSKNKNEEYTVVTNGTHEYNTTSDLDPTLKSNTVKPVDLSIVKIEPLDDDDDLQTNLETEPEQILPTLKTKIVEDDDLHPLPTIDDSISISLKKLKKFTANSSLSVTLKPIKNSKITKSSEDLLSKLSAKSCMSVTLRPKHNLSSPKNNSSPSISFTHCLPSTSNNSCPSVSLTHCLPSTSNNSSPPVSLTHCPPSTSSSSVYNISHKRLSQYKQKATSTLKMPNKLSSNTVINPEFIDNRMFLNTKSPTTKSNSSELPEIKTPIISKCISLATNSDTHGSNLDYSTKTPPSYIVINDNDSEDFIEKDNGFIYEISKSVILPSVFWKSAHDHTRNSTVFYQQDNLYDTVKNVSFHNSLLPKIQIYGKKYKFNKPIRTKNELQNLLEKIDNVEKCYGFDLVIHENCIGYYDKSTEDITSCSVCQEKFQELHKITEFKTKTTESLEQKISERTAKVLELRENMENNKINSTPTELVTPRPTSLINSMRVYRH